MGFNSGVKGLMTCSSCAGNCKESGPYVHCRRWRRRAVRYACGGRQKMCYLAVMEDQTGNRHDAYAGVRVSTELELCLQGTSDTVSNFCLSDGRSLRTAFLPPCTKTSFRCINRVAWFLPSNSVYRLLTG